MINDPYFTCNNTHITLEMVLRDMIIQDAQGRPMWRTNSTGGGGGSSIYAGDSPTNTQWGAIPPGTDLTGMTYDAIIEMATIAYIQPLFNSFAITGQAQTVEVGTTVSGSKTFTWNINAGSGTVPNIDIYDNTNASNIVSNTANDGTQSAVITSTTFTAQGQTLSFKGIGHNTSPTANFNSSNFVITGSYIEFYGPTAAAAADSAQVRALPLNRFVSSGNSFSFATGNVEKIFQIAMPATKTLTTVFDSTAGIDVTSGFILSTFNVLDAAGNNVSYNVYTLTAGVPYASSHNFNITTS